MSDSLAEAAVALSGSVPIQVTGDEESESVIEIVLCSGERLRVRAAASPDLAQAAVRVYVATGTTDLRRSIDGLAALAREHFAFDPLSGYLFLFRNRRGDRLKIDQAGFWVLYRRLERGTFAWARRMARCPHAAICSNSGVVATPQTDLELRRGLPSTRE